MNNRLFVVSLVAQAFLTACNASPDEPHPIKDYGAIAQGVHRFCDFKSGKCEGAADFLILWRKQREQWTITRVFSFGHRSL